MTRNGVNLESAVHHLSLMKEIVTNRFEPYLCALLPPSDDTRPLIDAMNYSLLAGGKRLRPLLCMTTANTFGVAPERVFPVSAALEAIHTYSLIHDDLPCMDNDDLRRGRPTNHKIFGEAMALLAGDGLLTFAFELLTTANAPDSTTVKMVRSLAAAAGPYGMVGGQVADMQAGSKTLERLQFIHLHKTGRLIQAAIELGAHMGGAHSDDLRCLNDFGAHIGRAFQMVDDWLDVCGSTEELGKPVGSDEENDKLTYPALFGPDETLRMAEDEHRQALEALASLSVDGSLLSAVAQMMIRRRK